MFLMGGSGVLTTRVNLRKVSPSRQTLKATAWCGKTLPSVFFKKKPQVVKRNVYFCSLMFFISSTHMGIKTPWAGRQFKVQSCSHIHTQRAIQSHWFPLMYVFGLQTNKTNCKTVNKTHADSGTRQRKTLGLMLSQT